MEKKYSYYIILLTFCSLSILSCKNKESKTVTDNSNSSNKTIVIRPILEEHLEEKNDSIKSYYALFDNYEIWFDNKNRSELIQTIQNSDEDGLNPKDYQYEKIRKLELKRFELDDEETSAYDVLLTEMFYKLANDLFYGKLNPFKLYNDWDLTKKHIVLSNYLLKAIQEKRIASAILQLKPQHETYTSLQKALREIKTYQTDKLDKIVIAAKIEKNASDSAVKAIKKRLQYWGDYQRKDSIFDFIYDSYTVEAVKKFQKRHGLTPDGVIGNATVRALNISRDYREKQLIVNLERWRWFPKNFGNDYIIVNLPNYKLDYVTYNDTIMDKNIVIGTKKRKTPILISKISNLVINPTWTVPPTIIKEDLTPKATRDRGYFSRTRLTIYKNGEIVSPTDWDPEKSKGYRYVQDIGYNNSLGLVKFNFPNKHMVYLHDTNHRDYFTRENRALSSGCVRVEKPLELANLILKKENKSWESAKMDTIIKNKKTKTIGLKTSIDVYLLYWTAWKSKNGLEFREDIYDLDTDLYAKLRS